MVTERVSSAQLATHLIEPPIVCSIGVMAYNEEANIGRLLTALLAQETTICSISEIIVLASGCTDRTEEIVSCFCRQNDLVKLIVQPTREGKASAINQFLLHAKSDILVMVSADTLPQPDTISILVAPFANPEVGMTGGHPVPINDPNTMMGFVVNLLWELHHQIACEHPKLGELTAFRRVFYRIPQDSAVDEANMEPLITGQGFQLCYVPQAIVRNRGAETVRDFLKQRRRIHAGHLNIRRKQGYAVATMNSGTILAALARCWRWEWRYARWVPVAIGLETYGRFLGWFDFTFKRRSHAVWDIAASTKGAIE